MATRRTAPGAGPANRRRARLAIAALAATFVVVGALLAVSIVAGPLGNAIRRDEQAAETDRTFEADAAVQGTPVDPQLMASLRADYPGFRIVSMTMLTSKEDGADTRWRLVLASKTSKDFSLQVDYDRPAGVPGSLEPWRSNDAFFSGIRYSRIAARFIPRFAKDHPDEIVVAMTENATPDGHTVWTIDTVTFNDVERQHEYTYAKGAWKQVQP